MPFKKSHLFPIIAVFIVIIFAGTIIFRQQFLSRGDQKKVMGAKVKITASFYPLGEFARKVGGDFVEVSSVTPSGVEPHDFEPTPQQVVSVYDSNLLIFNGGGVDVWAAHLAPSVIKYGVHVLEIDKLMTTLLPPPTSEEQSAFDPHFWLNPVLAEKQVEAIRDELSIIDSVHADIYRKNAEMYNDALRNLDTAFKTGLESCTLHTVVTSHAAFAYLAKQYGFIQLPISGISPDEEPSAGKLAEIAVQAKKQGIKYIFFETLVNPGLAKTLAREVGAQTLVFNPLEGLTDVEIAAGKDYVSVMQENLQNLRIAMGCTSL